MFYIVNSERNLKQFIWSNIYQCKVDIFLLNSTLYTTPKSKIVMFNFYLLQWKPFENNDKGLKFFKSSFCQRWWQLGWGRGEEAVVLPLFVIVKKNREKMKTRKLPALLIFVIKLAFIHCFVKKGFHCTVFFFS